MTGSLEDAPHRPAPISGCGHRALTSTCAGVIRRQPSTCRPCPGSPCSPVQARNNNVPGRRETSVARHVCDQTIRGIRGRWRRSGESAWRQANSAQLEVEAARVSEVGYSERTRRRHDAHRQQYLPASDSAGAIGTIAESRSSCTPSAQVSELSKVVRGRIRS